MAGSDIDKRESDFIESQQDRVRRDSRKEREVGDEPLRSDRRWTEKDQG